MTNELECPLIDLSAAKNVAIDWSSVTQFAFFTGWWNDRPLVTNLLVDRHFPFSLFSIKPRLPFIDIMAT